jgi:hypothetical protein
MNAKDVASPQARITAHPREAQSCIPPVSSGRDGTGNHVERARLRRGSYVHNEKKKKKGVFFFFFSIVKPSRLGIGTH